MEVTKIDHIGWDLWRATFVWKRRFTNEMLACGYDWYGEARGSLLQHIGSRGIAQLEIAARAGISKQAVQQLLDELVRDGVVERIPDANDARKKQIRLTPQGLEVLQTANVIKAKIEKDYEKLMGKAAMGELKSMLSLIISSEKTDDG